MLRYLYQLDLYQLDLYQLYQLDAPASESLAFSNLV